MRARTRLMPADIALIAVSLLAVGASAFAAARNGTGRERLIVETPAGEFVYSLDEDAVIRAEGPLGETMIVVEDGSARIESSPCDNGLCVAMGRIGAAGQWASCLPNRVFLRVSGAAGKDEPDALAY